MSQTPRHSMQAGAAATMLQRATDLAPLVRQHADANEATGRLQDEVVDSLRTAGLFGIFTPHCLGGAQLDPLDAIRVVEEVAQADAATSWVLFAVALCNATAGAFLGDEAVAHLFANGRAPVTAGQGIPNGKAVVDHGKYRLTGRWNYGSGVKHADWIHTGAIVHENGAPRLDSAGAPEIRILYVPREAVSFGENWDVLGLGGTGSIDYSVNDVLVDAPYTYHSRTIKPLRGGNIYSMGAIGMGSAGHTAFALGVGRRLLDELAAFARTKVGRPGLLGESESFLENYADAEAKLRAARALVHETWADAQQTLHAGDPLSTRQVTLIRLGLNHTTWTVSAISDFVYKAAGGVALRKGAIQRYFRDMHAGTQHITSSATLLRECGRDLSGIATGKSWAFLGLVDKVGG